MAIAYRASGAFVDANSTTTGSIGLPAGLANGDTLILVAQSRGTGATVTTPSGYTIASNIQITNSHRLHVFYKYVTNAAGETAPAVVQSVSGAIRARLSAFSGANATTQLDVTPQSSKSADALAVVAPSISTATTGAMVIWCFSAGDDVTLNAATQGTNAYSSDGTLGNDGSIALTYELQTSATSTGTCTMTESVNGPDNWCTITLALRPTVTAASDPTRNLISPDGVTYALEVAFGDSPFTSTPTWTDISAYVRADTGITVTRGRNSTFSDIQPGTMSFTLDNRTRLFDPDYSAGTYFGKLLPQVRCRLRARKSSVNYPIFDGYIQGWPQGYSYPREAVVQVNCVDLMSRLTTRLLPATLLDLECFTDGAVGHWPLDEDIGNVAGIAFDVSGHGADGHYNESPTVDSFLLGESNRKCKYFGQSDQNMLDFGSSDDTNLTLNAMHTFEFWVRIDGFITTAVFSTQGLADLFHQGSGPPPPPLDPVITALVQCQAGILYCTFQNHQQFIGEALMNEYSSLDVTLYDATNTLITTISSPFPLGEPLHVAVVANEGYTTLTLYLNGVQVGQSTGLSGTFEAGSREPGIGLTSIGFVGGAYAHFAVYETELTATQIFTHYNAGTIGGRGQYPSDRLEQIAEFSGLIDASQFDDSDLTDHTYLSSVKFDTNVLAAMQDIVRTEQGRLFVDATGVIQVQGRTADLKDVTVNTTSQFTTSDTGAGAYTDITVDAASLELIRNTIYLSTNGGQVTVYDLDSRALYDEQSESITALLDDATAARNLGLWRTLQFADPATRITSVTLTPHGSTDTRYAFVFAVDLGWRVTISRTPQAVGSAISKVCTVEGISHTVSERGPWTTTLYLAPAIESYTTHHWFVLGDATYGKLDGTNHLVY